MLSEYDDWRSRHGVGWVMQNLHSPTDVAVIPIAARGGDAYASVDLDTWPIPTHSLVLTTRKFVSVILTAFKVSNLNGMEADQHNNNPPMLLPEIEAALALAAMATCSAVLPTRSSSEDEAVAAFRENKCGMATSALISGVTDTDAPTKQCNRSNRWNSSKRENLTEDDKEARRIRRVLANRESARQTIRRRKAMHSELIRKAVDLSEENENLKMEKELAVEAYNSLKSRNKFLRLQVANAKKSESREIEEQPKSSQAEKHTSATKSSPMSLYHQPSVIPFFWPSVPTSNVIHYQYPSYYDVMSLSESSLQHRDMSTLQPGPEFSLGGTGPGNSLYVFPLPWVLPFPSYGPMLPSSSNTERSTNKILSTHQCSMSLSSDNLFVVENNELSSKLYQAYKKSLRK